MEHPAEACLHLERALDSPPMTCRQVGACHSVGSPITSTIHTANAARHGPDQPWGSELPSGEDNFTATAQLS